MPAHFLASRPKKKGFLHLLKKQWELLLIGLPGIIIVFIFNYMPLYGLILPFKDYRYDLGFWKSPWTGFENFRFLFSSDAALRITRNTLLLNTCFILVLTLTSLFLALLLNELTAKFVKLFQTALFFPYFLSWVVVSYIFLAIFDMEHGVANNLLELFGREGILWYNEPKYWAALLTIGNTWKSAGYYCIIYYTGLMSIDKEYYEAAALDGASFVQRVRYISIPMIRPLIAMLVLLQVSKIFFGNFDMIYNVTRNASALYPVTDVVDTYVYRAMSRLGDIGMASAAGAYQSVVGFIIVMFTNTVVRRLDPDSALF